MVNITIQWTIESKRGASILVDRKVVWPFLPQVGVKVDTKVLANVAISEVVIALDGTATLVLKSYVDNDGALNMLLTDFDSEGWDRHGNM